MKKVTSAELFERAKKVIPGGVNSPVRAFKSVGGNPIFMKRGLGSKMWDVEGNQYIDYIGSWGPHLFGHNPNFIQAALLESAAYGTSFGAPSEMEVKMAELITELVPSVEMVRMTSSGTEAAMSAIRLARGYTGKDKIIKFEGCYHGHGDSFLIKAGSGALTFGVPTSPGITKGTAADTLTANYNDLNSVRELFRQNKGEIAAVIVEPVPGNMGVILPEGHFLSHLHDLCGEEGALIIFDEVMSGFRVARGGAQERYTVIPDLTIFGKIIGGGMPVGAFGGIAEIMEHISPAGPVYQAGTLSGNPMAMAAGYSALTQIKDNVDIYRDLEYKSNYLEVGLRKAFDEKGSPYCINRAGSMMTVFFTEGPVNDFASATKSDTAMFAKYFNAMLKEGVYLAPSQFEAIFISTAHDKNDLDFTIEAARKALQSI